MQSALALLCYLLSELDQVPRPRVRRRLPTGAAKALGVVSERRARSARSRAAQWPNAPLHEPATELAIRCFGRFEVFREGKLVDDWRRGKARSLLKLLVTEGHPVPRDVLAERLWPQYAVEPARNNLRVTLHALRQALGQTDAGKSLAPEYVVFVDGHFVLNHGRQIWIDVDEFDAAFARGFLLERQNRLAEAMRAYERAEVLYRDDYLVEDLYEDWAGARRERLKDQYLLLVTRLADYTLAQGDAFGCIVRCHAILQKDPCREDAYVRLMRCYHGLGQLSQAIHWYDVCARTLRLELDVGPSDATNLLLARIRAGHDQPGGFVPLVPSRTIPMTTKSRGEKELECRGGSGERSGVRPAKQRG